MRSIQIKARIFEGTQVWQDVTVYLDECEPNRWDAEIKIPLYINPNDLRADIYAAMDEERISGVLEEGVKFEIDNQVTA